MCERQTDTHTQQTDRQTYRQTDRQTDTADRQTEMPTDRQTDRHRGQWWYRGVDRAELWGGGSKQLKIPPGGGFGRGCNISYIFFGGGGGGGSGQPGNPFGYTLVVNDLA